MKDKFEQNKPIYSGSPPYIPRKLRNKFDVIIVGSGAAGAHVAYPLVKGGLNVLMIDGGVESNSNLEEEFKEDFEDIRRNRKDQYKLFLGEKLTDIAPPKNKEVRVISMAGGNREYVSKNTNLLPIESKGVQVVQSLAKGGLSEIWAALCSVFNKEELQAVGIPENEIKDSYQEVMDMIGVSGDSKDYSLQKPLDLNNHAKKVLEKYQKLNNKQKDGFVVKPPLHAVITEDSKNRKAFVYKDLEYVLNIGKSIYKPSFTIEELEKEENFHYFPGRVVQKISKDKESRKVEVKRFDGNEEIYFASNVILAAGALNSTRILLKSFNLLETRVPFITKTHFIIPSIHLKTLGKKDNRRQSSLSQLIIEDTKEGVEAKNRLFAQFHTYKSFLLWRLVKYIPLSLPEAMNLLSILTPSFVMLDVRFPSLDKKNNTELYLNGNGEVVIGGEEIITPSQKKRLRAFKKILLKLGLLPLRTVRHPFGSTAHYAGGIPISKKGEFPLTTNPNGKLNEDEKIYVADSATWKTLPAKAPTLTIMANANRIGRNFLKEFKKVN